MQAISYALGDLKLLYLITIITFNDVVKFEIQQLMDQHARSILAPN